MNQGERDWLWMAAAGALALVAISFALPSSPLRACFGLTSEDTVPMKDVPEAVRATAGKELGALDDCKASRSREFGKVRWEIEKKVEGGTASLVLSDAGDLMETGKPVAIERVPKSVRDAVAVAFPKAAITQIETVEKRSYEFTLTVDGRKRRVKVDLDGAIELSQDVTKSPADDAKKKEREQAERAKAQKRAGRDGDPDDEKDDDGDERK